jgi:hypothetical protein
MLAAFPAQAQDARAYTTVSDLQADSSGGTIIARSLTLMHGGKVYDYMQDVGEVVIYEPVHYRFVILNDRQIATTVSFTELRQILSVARSEMETAISDLRDRSDERSREVLHALEFQLAPVFEVSRQGSEIQLVGDHVDYEVATTTSPAPEFSRDYLDYADWAAQLNFALHPHSQFPEVRRSVNEQMRAGNELPLTVELRAALDAPVHLRADHRYVWDLQPSDRALINKWERLLASEQITWLSFHDYQHALLEGP